MNYEKLLTKHPHLIIKLNEHLSDYTFTKTGGPAELLFFPTKIDEINDVLKWTNDNKIPLTVIGNGSNLIIRDGGISGAVMVLTDFNKVNVEGNKIKAQAGAMLINVSELASKQKLSGLEFACGIPGTIGGAVYMNAGAYGGEVKDVIETVTLLTRSGKIISVQNRDMNFSYRSSNIMNTGSIVLDVTFSLKRSFLFKIKLKMSRVTYLRNSKQPLEYPSCGSVFKTSETHPTSRLIKEMGLQGKTIGGAQISKKHPNFIVNIGNATSTDYIELIEFIKKEIFIKYGYEFEVEPLIIGNPIEKNNMLF